MNGLVRQLEASGETEISSTELGRLVMDTLRGIDAVAYVRFASVYRDFREARDFEAIVGSLSPAADPSPPATEADAAVAEAGPHRPKRR